MKHRGLFFGLLLMVGSVLLADEPETLAIGEKAPAFSLVGIDALLAGKAVPVESTKAFGCSMKWKSKVSWRTTLDVRWKETPVELISADLEGIKEVVQNSGEKYRLINVWATWCGPCVIEFPEFVSMQRMYGQRNFEVVSISADKLSAREKVMTFLTEHQAAFPNYIYTGEDQQAFINSIDPHWQGNLPYTMLIAPEGEVVYRHAGIIDPLEVKRAVVEKLGRYFADDCNSADGGGKALFEKENLVAWCIVPFDAERRTPQERAEMLDNLGLSHFAYDYRDEHIPSFREEIEALKDHHITLSAVWLWVDPGWEEPLNNSGRAILDILKETGTETEIWLGFPDNAFEGMTDEESLTRAVDVAGEILQEAAKIGCTLALYNHGGWFGEPDNLVRIIESLSSEQIKVVYNFHHGHHQVEQFQDNLEKMLPYLSTININGMRVEGPKIITLGEGDRELEMLRIIVNSGYTGPIGILGHTEGEDINMVLERNLLGLEELRSQL